MPAFPQPPSKIVPFNSGPVAPHDIGRQFDEHRRGFGEVIDFLKEIVREDGRLGAGTVGLDQLDPELPNAIAAKAMVAVEDLLATAKSSVRQAQTYIADMAALRDQIALQQTRITEAADLMSRLNEEVQIRLRGLNDQVQSHVTALVGAGVLGPQVTNFYATDEQSSAPLASDYAQVSIEWAEHMPDTIPPNILAVNAITGEHWSSRWWAHQSANAFGMLAWWYMGAWPQPGPPSTPNTPTGAPIPPGSMYFDTDLGTMLVWNGSTWVNPFAPSKAVTASLFYLATAGQTVFPFSVLDKNGKTFAYNQTYPEGTQIYVNGVRLEPTVDYAIDVAASKLTFTHGLTVNALVTVDLLASASFLTPSGTVNTVLLVPLVPDGVKTVFSNLTVAHSGLLTNVAKNEELHVSVNGIIQNPGMAYTASGATITFAQAPEIDANVFITWFGPAGA